MLSVMLTTKKNFVAIQQKLDIWERRQKTHFPIRFSRARSRIPKLRVGAVNH
jgi:hypothetical protein